MPRPTVVVATRSRHKLAEIREILAAAPVEFASLWDAGVPRLEEEQGLESFDTFRENALAKARFFHAHTGLPTFADDSGLCVDALEGAPGVRSKRFAPEASAERLGRTEANNRLLLERLEGISPGRRGAHYHCTVAAVDDEGERTADGVVRGRIARTPRGDGGFGYDPLFVLPAYAKTYAELPPEVKRRTSHRSKALRRLLPWFYSLGE